MSTVTGTWDINWNKIQLDQKGFKREGVGGRFAMDMGAD